MANFITRWWRRWRGTAAPVTATKRDVTPAARDFDAGMPVYSALFIRGCGGVHYFDLAALTLGLDRVPAEEVSDRVVVRTEQLATLSPEVQAAVMLYERVPGGRRVA